MHKDNFLSIPSLIPFFSLTFDYNFIKNIYVLCHKENYETNIIIP